MITLKVPMWHKHPFSDSFQSPLNPMTNCSYHTISDPYLLPTVSTLGVQANGLRPADCQQQCRVQTLLRGYSSNNTVGAHRHTGQVPTNAARPCKPVSFVPLSFYLSFVPYGLDNNMRTDVLMGHVTWLHATLSHVRYNLSLR